MRFDVAHLPAVHPRRAAYEWFRGQPDAYWEPVIVLVTGDDGRSYVEWQGKRGRPAGWVPTDRLDSGE